MLGVAASVLAIAGLSAVGYVISLAADAPSLDGKKANDQGASSVVFAAGDERLGIIEADVIRFPVARADVPQTVRDATVAIEDERFWRHSGVDAEGVVRAALKNVEEGRTVEGGSTITMQLARALYLNNERSFERKIQEARVAQELEERHTKDWILHEYLNNAPYGTNGGQTAVGINAAARTYFNKPSARLELHEAALLAGLPQAPSQYNPFREPGRARARRNQVLRKMAENGFIQPGTAAEAMERPLGVKENDFYTRRREQFFFDYVRDELVERYGVETVRRGGLRVYTTIDLRRQRQARAAIRSVLTSPTSPSSAIVTIEPKTGYIRAMASSANYGESKFNLAADGKRQPGSTFKIMGLVAALQKGISPEGTSYTSKDLKFTDPEYGSIDVSCYGGSCSGATKNLVSATVTSDNSVYQQLALDIGPESVKDAARDMGITSQLDGYPGEVLGGLENCCTPLEMARAYATLAGGGVRVRPRAITRVEFPDGRVSKYGPGKRERVFSEAIAAKVTDILQRNVIEGTGTRAQIGCPVAGKTGTTDQNRNAWFVGYTPNLATATWVGFPKNQLPMQWPNTPINVDGGTYPAQIWGAYMREARKGCPEFELEGGFSGTTLLGSDGANGAVPPATGTPGVAPTPAPAPPTQDTPSPPAPSTPEADTGGGEEDGGYSPDLYETPPQSAPDTGPTTGGVTPEG
jgi:penicillin-binding protein 1A